MQRFLEGIGSNLESLADTVSTAVRNAEQTFTAPEDPSARNVRARGAGGTQAQGLRRQQRSRRQEQEQPVHQSQYQHGPHENNPAPPASNQAIRQLPTIRVAPEDLVDPNNRECCICLEENSLGSHVLRIPCSHIYHRDCLHEWLSKNCTCPICRLELETDDAQYEVGRLERMKHRKPRYAMYELKRLTIPELKQLFRATDNMSGLEKSELVQLAIDKERVDLVPAPKPVRYQLSKLKQMGISKLRKTMEDAGVFFRREDIVEKNDMYVLFQNSGRLELIPEDEEEEEEDDDVDVDSIVEACDVLIEVDQESIDDRMIRGLAIETVVSDDEEESKCSMTVVSIRGLNRSREVEESSQSWRSSTTNTIHQVEIENIPSGDIDDHTINSDQLSNADASQIQSENGHAQPASHGGYPSNSEAQPPPTPSVTNNVAGLQRYANENNIDLSVGVRSLDTLDTWSVSQLRVLAGEVNIDLSQSSDRESMVTHLIKEATSGNNPRIIPYLKALTPLATMPLADLRRTARHMNVNISDCIEKEEIIYRLIQGGKSRIVT